MVLTSPSIICSTIKIRFSAVTDGQVNDFYLAVSAHSYVPGRAKDKAEIELFFSRFKAGGRFLFSYFLNTNRP